MPRVTRTTTKARRREESRSKRDSIVAAAEVTFLAEGYQGATTDRIASRAGVSVGTVYNVCGSKERMYAMVAENVGRALLTDVEASVLPVPDPDAAIEKLIRLRLADFERHRLLFVLFSSDRRPGGYPEMTGVSAAPGKLYQGYLGLVAQVFERGMDLGVFERMHPLHLTLSFEGVLNAFVGYWMSPEGDENAGTQARCIRETFMKMAGLKRAASVSTPERHDSRPRGFFVTSFDTSRLKELIAVARAFGSDENAAHLDVLETALANSKVVEPVAVPRDVITMNSRIELRRLPSAEPLIVTLVFPSDADADEGNQSILSPLGTALLGRRVGDTVEVDFGNSGSRFEVAELLYQPEAAGDFHR